MEKGRRGVKWNRKAMATVMVGKAVCRGAFQQPPRLGGSCVRANGGSAAPAGSSSRRSACATLRRGYGSSRPVALSTIQTDDGLHARVVFMPAIMTGKHGRVDKWLKKEGDRFTSTEPLCEVTISQDAVFDNYNDVQVAVDAHAKGVLSKILVQPGDVVPVDSPIAHFVDDMKEYMELVEQSRLASAEAELMEEMKPPDEATVKNTSKTLMREIRHLMKKGDIDQNTEFAKELQYLARKGNPELVSIFESSFDGAEFNEDTFDIKFFLENAEEIVKESIEAKKNAS